MNITNDELKAIQGPETSELAYRTDQVERPEITARARST